MKFSSKLLFMWRRRGRRKKKSHPAWCHGGAFSPRKKMIWKNFPSGPSDWRSASCRSRTTWSPNGPVVVLLSWTRTRSLWPSDRIYGRLQLPPSRSLQTRLLGAARRPSSRAFTLNLVGLIPHSRTENSESGGTPKCRHISQPSSPWAFTRSSRSMFKRHLSFSCCRRTEREPPRRLAASPSRPSERFLKRL